MLHKDYDYYYDRSIFVTLAGSHLYGTNTPESDIDTRGVCLQPVESLIGLQPFDQYQSDEPDTTIYGLNKFVKLASDCNPNIIELLFAPINERTCLKCTGKWLLLRANREAFLSRKAKHTFTGYAFAQLKRINTHYEWMNNPPKEEPVPEAFGAWLTDKGSYRWSSEQEHSAYSNARNHWNQYHAWRNNRNPARAKLEERWGYDTKHGQHLARLMTQGAELLETGRITLPRPDADWLREIRNGLMEYNEIVAWAKSMEEKIAKIEQSSPLPWGPDFNRINRLVMKINHDTVLKYNTLLGEFNSD